MTLESHEFVGVRQSESNPYYTEDADVPHIEKRTNCLIRKNPFRPKQRDGFFLSLRVSFQLT